MRETLAALRDGLGIEAHVRDAVRDITARASISWESLCELRADHLRSYGEVPLELASFLAPRIDELIRRLDRIRDAAGARPDELDSGSSRG